MKRLVLRWVALAVFLILLALVFIRLGEWQLNRLEGARERNNVVAANRDLPVVDYADVMGGPVDETTLWQRVRVTGTYTGRPVDVAVAKDGSLFVSDDYAGAIYRISYNGQ